MWIDKNEIKQELNDIKDGKLVQGLKIGIPEIDEYYRMKLGGSMDIYVGHANVGKTTFVLYLMTLYAVKYDLKYVVWSAENSGVSVIRKIIEFKMSKPIDDANEEEIDKATEWAFEHFYVIKIEELYTYKDVLAMIKARHNVSKIDAAMIDPYNALAKPKEEFKAFGGHEMDYIIASEFRIFAEQNKITLMICMHGVTEALRKSWPITHEYAGLPMPMSMSQVEGGSKWGNRSSNFYSLHRYTQSPDMWNMMEMHVLKVKEYETGGRPTSLSNPVKFQMMPNNVGYTFGGLNLMEEKKKPNKIEF